MKARFPGWCPRCDGGFRVGDDITIRKGIAIHAACAPGADDEQTDQRGTR